MRTRVSWRAWLIIAAMAIAVPLSAFGEIPWLNSNAGAPHTIYLDLDGPYEPASTNYCPPPLNAAPEGWPIDFETSNISGSLASQLDFVH